MGWYALLWAVPVCAAAAAVALVLAWGRRLEELSRGLVAEVRRLPELRSRLGALRQEFDRGEPVVDELWHHWTPEPPGRSGS